MITRYIDEHNHEISGDLSGHSFALRLEPSEQLMVRDMTSAGVTPSILSTLKRQCDNQLATRRDVYNQVAAARVEILAGRSPIQALMETLRDGPFEFASDFDDQGHVTRLFFSHTQSLQLAQRFSNVFLLDCTYKTNRFKILLLNIVGLDCSFVSFNAGFVFLREEKEADYDWALNAFARFVPSCSVLVTDRELALMNAIEKVYPDAKNILCLWHINKNILANCRKYFPAMQDEEETEWNEFLLFWNAFCHSESQELLDCNWRDFVEKYTHSHSSAVRYVENTWLIHQEKFVRFFVNQHLSLGVTTTSRAEGMHFVMKRYINLSRYDLFSAQHKINLMLETQFSDTRGRCQSEKTTIRHLDDIPLFHAVIRKVSRRALDLIQKENESENREECTGIFTRVHGVPCSHVLKSLVSAGRSVEMAMVNEQWHLRLPVSPLVAPASPVIAPALPPTPTWMDSINNRIDELSGAQQVVFLSRLDSLVSENIPEVQNPVVEEIRTRGRPKGSKNKTVQRDRSHFEHVEAAINGRKCSRCGLGGHNARTCNATIN